jgi:hypothetical protein
MTDLQRTPHPRNRFHNRRRRRIGGLHDTADPQNFADPAHVVIGQPRGGVLVRCSSELLAGWRASNTGGRVERLALVRIRLIANVSNHKCSRYAGPLHRDVCHTSGIEPLVLVPIKRYWGLLKRSARAGAKAKKRRQARLVRALPAPRIAFNANEVDVVERQAQLEPTAESVDDMLLPAV